MNNMALMLNPDIEIKDSPIQGKGIFTKVPIKKGKTIWVSKNEEPVEEKIYTDEEFKQFMQWCIENGKEWDAIANGDGTHSAAISDREKHPGDYGNHSCDPNTDRNRVALRDIAAGEELTSDYAQFSTKDWEMTCHCGAKNCKGVVQGNL
jgi:SET domain-containing protein